MPIFQRRAPAVRIGIPSIHLGGSAEVATDEAAVDALKRYLGILKISGDSWLRAPANELSVQWVERTLGFDLPIDLAALLRFHNGGRFFDAHDWIGCTSSEETGLVRSTRSFHSDLMAEFRSLDGALDTFVPGPRTLMVAATSQRGILYDIDLSSGQLLYFDVMDLPSVRPFANSLVSLAECFVDLAEAGLIEMTSIGPLVSGPHADVADICVHHSVRL